MKSISKGSLGSVDVKITLTSHTGKELDITAYFMGLEIIQDVSAFTSTGIITFIDSQGVLEFLPIVGGEKLRIYFNTDSSDKKFKDFLGTFIVTKIGTQNQVSDARTLREVKLIFCSEPLLVNYQKQYSKSYSKMKSSEIAKDICKNMLKLEKPLVTEDTKTAINYIIPYNNPLTSIQYLAKSEKDGFLFYEDSDNFYFQSLIKMYQQTPYGDKFILQRNFSADGNQRLTPYINRVLYFEHINGIDLLEQIKRGGTGSTIYTYDIMGKTWTKRTVDYSDVFKSNSIGSRLTVPTKFQSNEADISMFEDYFVDRIVDSDNDFTNIILDNGRAAVMSKIIYNSINSNSIVLGKFGDSGLTCGKIINVEYLSADSSQKVNDKLNGNYLVKSCKHKIDLSEGYTQVLLITKPLYSTDTKNVTKKV